MKSEQPRERGEVVFRAFDAFLGARPQIFNGPTGLGDANDGDVEPFLGDETQKSREDLLVGEIAGSASEHHGVGLSGFHLFLSGIEVGNEYRLSPPRGRPWRRGIRAVAERPRGQTDRLAAKMARSMLGCRRPPSDRLTAHAFDDFHRARRLVDRRP